MDDRSDSKKYKNDLGHFQYRNKFRTALTAGVLFILLSNHNAYKILDIIVNIFTNKLNILSEDDCNPHIIGTLLMTIIVTIIVFMV